MDVDVLRMEDILSETKETEPVVGSQQQVMR